MPRQDLEIRNRLHDWRGRAAVRFLARGWSVSLSANLPRPRPALQFWIEFVDGAGACISLSQPALETLSRLVLGAPAPPSLAPHLGLALVEHVLDELEAAWPSALARRSLARPEPSLGELDRHIPAELIGPVAELFRALKALADEEQLHTRHA